MLGPAIIEKNQPEPLQARRVEEREERGSPAPPTLRPLATAKQASIFAKPSLLGEAVCLNYEEQIEEEAMEACNRVWAHMCEIVGSNFVLSSLSLNLLNMAAVEGKSTVTSFGFNTPSPDDAVQNARMNKDTDLFSKTPIVKTTASPVNREASPARSQLSAGLSSGNL